MNHLFHGYAPHKGEMPGRTRGSLVAFEAGETSAYGLFGLQDRGILFLDAGIAVYEGDDRRENTQGSDMDVNPCKRKQITNMRASGFAFGNPTDSLFRAISGVYLPMMN